jgi:hypothetical protein
MEILAIKGDRVRLKNADTIALNAGVRKMTWPDAYLLVIAPSTDRFLPIRARSHQGRWIEIGPQAYADGSRTATCPQHLLIS